MIEVHRQLDPGFLEPVYQEAMEIEVSVRSIPFVAQQRIQIRYKERLLSKEYVADMVCYDKILVEFKALDCLTGREEAQVVNYLKATRFKVGY